MVNTLPKPVIPPGCTIEKNTWFAPNQGRNGSSVRPSEKEDLPERLSTDVKFIVTMHTLMDIIAAFIQLNIIFHRQDYICILQPANLWSPVQGQNSQVG